MATLRKAAELSQEGLAERLGMSQSSVSRIESNSSPPSDPRLLSRLARVFELPVSELLEEAEVPDGLTTELMGEFWAFCPNPFCDRNERSRSGAGDPVVQWKSGMFFDPELFAETNYCSRCGEELVKQCPSCKKPLRERGARYCTTCGTQLTDRPTEDEWDRIRREVTIAEPDDDLPF